MKKDEILKKLDEISTREDEIYNRMSDASDKGRKVQESEYPVKQWIADIREVQKEKLQYERMLTSDERREMIMKHMKNRKLSYSYRNGLYKTDVPENQEHAADLQKRLVQCCIDFIIEHDDFDIDIVDFHADGLQASSETGKWEPPTDSSICLKGVKYNTNDMSTETVVIGETN